MSTRRVFIGSLAGGLLAGPLAAGAQQARNVHRIGYLSGQLNVDTDPLYETFLGGLRELGYVEARNLAASAARPRAGTSDTAPSPRSW